MSDSSPICGGPRVARQPLGESHAEKLEQLQRSLEDPGALQQRSAGRRIVADLKATLTQIPTGQRQAVLSRLLGRAPAESRAALRAALEVAGETKLAQAIAALQSEPPPAPADVTEAPADSRAAGGCAASADPRAVLRALEATAKATAGTTVGAPRRLGGGEDGTARLAKAARTQAAAVGRLAERGIRIDPASVAVAGTATLTEAMSLQDLASAVFNVPADRVGPMHYQLLLRANPEVASRGRDRASIRLRPGETVSLGSSPVVLDLQRDQLRAGIANIESAVRFAGDPPLSQEERTRLQAIEASMQQQLREVEISAQATRGLLDVAEVSTATAPLAEAGDIDGLVARFAAVDARIAEQARALPAGSAERRKLEVVRTQLRMSRAAGLEKGAQALLSQNLDGPAARRAIEMARRDYQAVAKLVEPRHRVTFDLRQVALTRLEMSSYTYEPVLQKVQQAHGEPVKAADLEPAERRAFDNALRGINQASRRLRSQLEGIQSGDPPAKALVEEQLVRLPHVIRSTRADLYTSIGDRANAARELHEDLRAHSGIGAPAFATDESRYISTNNEELSWLGSVFRSDTTVGFLSRRKRDAIVSRIQGLSPESRDQALQVLYRIGGTHADMGDIDGTNAVRQVLLELGERTGDNAIVTQAMFIASNYRQQIGDMKGSTEVLLEAMETAARISDDNPLKGQLRARAAMAYAGSLAATAAAGESKGEREQAARSLSAFRQKLEQAREPLGKSQLGQLVLMEANAFVTSNQSRLAERAMAALAPYRDNPAIEKAYHSFFESNAKGNVEAAIKVALRELNNESLAEALSYGLGGAAVGAATGAAIGVWFFGVGALVGAGVGAIVGGAAGTATIKGINLYRGWDNIEQAADTGLTHLTLGDAVMDSMFLALDVAAAVLPFKGAGQIGKAGAIGLVRGAGTEVAEANLRAGNKLVRGYIRDMSEALVRREGTELTSEAVTQLARRLGLRDGDTFVRNVADQVGNLVRRGIDPADYLERAAKTAIISRGARGVQGQARDLLHEGLHTHRRHEPKPATTVKGWADNLFEEVLAPMHETAAFDMAELRRTLDDPEALEKWVAAKQARYSSPDLGGAELFGPPGQARAVVQDVGDPAAENHGRRSERRPGRQHGRPHARPRRRGLGPEAGAAVTLDRQGCCLRRRQWHRPQGQ